MLKANSVLDRCAGYAGWSDASLRCVAFPSSAPRFYEAVRSAATTSSA